jgi:tetratricopeptide (TPR) repeat protein
MGGDVSTPEPRNHDERDRVEEITRRVLEFLSSYEPRARPDRLRSFVSAIGENLGIAIALGTVILLAIGFLAYGISPTTVIGEVVADYRDAQEREQLVLEHIELGNRFLDVEQLKAARTEFKEALKLDPTNVDAQRGLFKTNVFEPVVKRQYDPEVVELRLKSLLREEPDDPNAHAFLGDIYWAQGYPDRALTQYDRAIEEAPTFAHAYAGKGFVYDVQNRSEQALEMFQRALELSPWNRVYRDNLAYLLFSAGRYRDAFDQYDRLSRVDPNLVSSYIGLGNTYRVLGDLPNARFYQAYAVELLLKRSIQTLELNSRSWFYHTKLSPPEEGAPLDGDIVWLDGFHEKQWYGMVNLAFTHFLQGHERRASVMMDRANGLDLDAGRIRDIRRIVLFDIRLQIRETKGFRLACEAFRVRFL